MSGFFKFARTDTTTRYHTPDGDDYIDLRAELSKAEANQILSAAPSGDRDIEGGLAFFEHFLNKVGVGWSMRDEEGHEVKLNVENYRLLDAAIARWIDEQLGVHLNKTLGTKVEEDEEIEQLAYDMMKGNGKYTLKKLNASHPTLYQHYENYLHCRSTQLMIFRKPDGKNEKIVTVVWPTGYRFPGPGGLQHQSYYEMRMLAACLRGEQRAVGSLMAR